VQDDDKACIVNCSVCGINVRPWLNSFVADNVIMWGRRDVILYAHHDLSVASVIDVCKSLWTDSIESFHDLNFCLGLYLCNF